MGKWTAEEVWPVVDSLTRVIMEDQHFTGVAVTGSVGRLEFPVNDIDLVVFHDGSVRDGSWSDPPKDTRDVYAKEASPFASPYVSRIKAARKDISVDFIAVNQRALWDCEHLRSLKPIERFTDFYLRVFCDPELPLLVWSPELARKPLRDFVLKNGLFRTVGGQIYIVSRVRHECSVRHKYSTGCRPTQSWHEAKQEMMQRKANKPLFVNGWYYTI